MILGTIEKSFYERYRNKLFEVTQEQIDALHEALLGTHEEMVKRCPVLTGRLRYGIYLSEDVPSDFCPPPAPNKQPEYYPPPDPPSLSPGVASNYIFGDNVPYAAMIEYHGYSKKAPEGFMRVSLDGFFQRLQAAYAARGIGGPRRRRTPKQEHIARILAELRDPNRPKTRHKPTRGFMTKKKKK